MLANNSTTAKAIQNLNSLSVVIYLIVNDFQIKKASLPFGRPANSPTTFLFPSCSGCKSVVDSDLV